MTKQEIIEGNKLIAEFMGYKLDGDIVRSAPLDADGFDSYDGLVGYKITHAQYDSSWDRLMTVVDKIQKIYETKREFGVIIEITTTHIRISMKSFNYYIDKTSDDWIPFDIKILFKVVVEFIKWYNTQK